MPERDEPEPPNISQAVEQSLEMYRLLAENVSDVIWILDLDVGRFRYISPSVKGLTGYTAEELTAGKLSQTLLPATYQMLEEKITARIPIFRQGQHIHYVDEFQHQCKDGSFIWTESTTSFHINETNNHLEIFGVSRDVSRRRHDAAFLNLRVELLEIAPDLSLDEFMPIALDKIAAFTDSTLGFYHLVDENQAAISLQTWYSSALGDASIQIERVTRYSPADSGPWVNCVRQRAPVILNNFSSIPDDQKLPPGYPQIQRAMIVPVFRSEKVVSVLCVGNKSTDYTEKNVEWAAYLADLVWEVAKRKQAEHNLSELQARLNLLSQNLEEAGLYVYAHDAQGKPHFEYLSAGMELLTGIADQEAFQDAANIHNLLLPEYLPRLFELETISKKDLVRFEMEARMKHAITGEIRWMLLRSTPRPRPDGSTVWYGVQVDISAHKQNEELRENANEQMRIHMLEIEELLEILREQSLRDPLTNLYNRRYLNETMDREIARAEREKSPLSIIVSDIDGFKSVNDTYGHWVGDQFLIKIARLMGNNSRRSDIVCRYGGEEFLLVLPGTSTESAFRRAKELNRKCAELTLEHNGKALTITMSFGVATYPTHGQDADKIISKADKALYKSKETGRNRVTVWEEPEPSNDQSA